MKRIATIAAIITAAAVAAPFAVAGNDASSSQVAKAKRAAAGVSAQRRVPGFAFQQSGLQYWRAGNHLLY